MAVRKDTSLYRTTGRTLCNGATFLRLLALAESVPLEDLQRMAQCLISTSVGVPGKTRLPPMAEHMARDCNELLCTWEVACAECQLGDRLAEFVKRGVMPVLLVSHKEGRETVYGHFLFPEERIAGLFQPDEIIRLPDDVIVSYAEQDLHFFKPHPLVALPWVVPDNPEPPWE